MEQLAKIASGHSLDKQIGMFAAFDANPRLPKRIMLDKIGGGSHGDASLILPYCANMQKGAVSANTKAATMVMGCYKDRNIVVMVDDTYYQEALDVISNYRMASGETHDIIVGGGWSADVQSNHAFMILPPDASDLMKMRSTFPDTAFSPPQRRQCMVVCLKNTKLSRHIVKSLQYLSCMSVMIGLNICHWTLCSSPLGLHVPSSFGHDKYIFRPERRSNLIQPVIVIN